MADRYKKEKLEYQTTVISAVFSKGGWQLTEISGEKSSFILIAQHHEMPLYAS